MTRKEIFAQFGIEYKDNKIKHNVLGFVRLPLVNGNDKIGKGCWHFSTLPTNITFLVRINGKEYELFGTCPCTCKDKDGKTTCYATKGNYNYKSVKNALGMRTWLAYNDIDFLRRAIMAQIIADKILIVRIHVAGDFFSDLYIEMWKDIVKAFPHVVFWSYTKNIKAEKAFDDFDNINIVKSVVRGFGFNYGHIDYIIKVYNALKSAGKSVYICKCGIDKNQHCITCGACRTCEYVLFVEHSTDYKAEKDPLFPVFCDLVAAQDDIVLDIAA